MKITSVDTDKNSDYSYCAWVLIAAGRILSVSEEMIREGGVIWSKSNTANGTLPEVMALQARNFPNFYHEVQKAAHLDKLPTINTVKRQHADYDVNSLKGDIEELEAKILEKRRKLRKIRKAR